MLKIRTTPPVIDSLNLDARAVEAAIAAAARRVMRRKGLAKGANLKGASRAAVKAAADEVDGQLERRGVNWHPSR